MVCYIITYDKYGNRKVESFGAKKETTNIALETEIVKAEEEANRNKQRDLLEVEVSKPKSKRK